MRDLPCLLFLPLLILLICFVDTGATSVTRISIVHTPTTCIDSGLPSLELQHNSLIYLFPLELQSRFHFFVTFLFPLSPL
ncbi:hypothetical protein F5Y02DRAFT_396939 [Annulohypoxylon stygium]|nr:hypothetical protein F5Y02DRAFT_396939 [Annulohypoxylon stygium]